MSKRKPCSDCHLECFLIDETLPRLFLQDISYLKEKRETVEDNPGGLGMTPLNLTAAVKKGLVQNGGFSVPRITFHGTPLQELLHALSKNLFELS